MNRFTLLLLCATALAWGAEPPPAPGPRHVVITQPAPEDEMATATIPLRALSWEEAEPLLRPLLSPAGNLGYFAARHTLIVHDRQRHVDQVKRVVAAMDAEVVNVRLEVELQDELREYGRGASLLVEERRGGGGTATLRLEDQRRETTRNDRLMLLARSGAPARLWVGETIADPTWLRDYRLVPLLAVVAPGATLIVQPPAPQLVWRDVGAALYMQATAMDNGLVRIQMFPVVSFRDGDGREHRYRVEQVQTEVFARDGQRVFVGGADEASRQFASQLFAPLSRRERGTTRGFSLYVTPHVQALRAPATP
jgi:hypothetical protein